MSVTICKPFAAFELGFRSSFLNRVQESVWSRWDDDLHDIAPGLEDISRHILALSDRFDQYRWLEELRIRIEDGHRQAVLNRNFFLFELKQELGTDYDAVQHYSSRLREKAKTLRDEQVCVWEALCVFTRKCVEHDLKLVAWWEIGFAIASLVFRPDAKNALLSYDDEGIDGLNWDVAKLDEADVAWVKDLLPTEFRGTIGDTLSLLRAYHQIKALLPEKHHQQDRTSIERLFRHNPNFSECWWHVTGNLEFDETERVVVQRLFEDMHRGGKGVETTALLKGTRRVYLTRLDGVFIHGKHSSRRYNPAWSEGLIESVYGGKYRLSLRGHTRTHTNAHS